MKFFIALLVMMSVSAQASLLCEVDGISDSPQSLDCSITRDQGLEKVSLFCKDGVYFLKWQNKNYEVTVAYHEEVETGSSPLIFETDGLRLKTTANHNQNHAEFRVGSSLGDGLCISK